MVLVYANPANNKKRKFILAGKTTYQIQFLNPFAQYGRRDEIIKNTSLTYKYGWIAIQNPFGSIPNKLQFNKSVMCSNIKVKVDEGYYVDIAQVLCVTLSHIFCQVEQFIDEQVPKVQISRIDIVVPQSNSAQFEQMVRRVSRDASPIAVYVNVESNVNFIKNSVTNELQSANFGRQVNQQKLIIVNSLDDQLCDCMQNPSKRIAQVYDSQQICLDVNSQQQKQSIVATQCQQLNASSLPVIQMAQQYFDKSLLNRQLQVDKTWLLDNLPFMLMQHKLNANQRLLTFEVPNDLREIFNQAINQEDSQLLVNMIMNNKLSLTIGSQLAKSMNNECKMNVQTVKEYLLDIIQPDQQTQVVFIGKLAEKYQKEIILGENAKTDALQAVDFGVKRREK